MARGLALIAVAVVLGIVLLNATDAERPAVVGVGAGETTATTEVSGGSTSETTEPAVPIAHDPAAVTVLVANGSGVKGAAAKVAEVLKASNFVTATPANTKSPVNASAVYYAAGYEADARAVAALLKPSPSVSVLPATLPVADLAGAQVLVVVAADLAAPASSPGSTSTSSHSTSSTTDGGPPTSVSKK